MSEIAIDMRGVNKTFGPVKALENANLKVASGTIHGLVGQNGAGKSTIIKVLAGIYGRDGGTVSVYGKDLRAITPASIEEEGVHFIHQDRLLVPTATIAEAIFLRNEPRFGPFINYGAMNRRASELLKRYFSLSIDPRTLISELSTAQQKIVQITRALIANPKVLVFDEPTAALVRREVDLLFQLIRRLSAEGVTILYISHYLGEIADLCDTVTVLRNGRDVATLPVAKTSAAEIGALMVNRDIGELYPKPAVTPGEVLLEVDNLALADRFDAVSFSLRKGEVLGFTGLVGSGAKEVVRTLFGLDRPTGGTVSVKGETVFCADPAAATDRHLALVPEDRRRDGVALDLSVTENTTLASLDRFSHGLIDRGAERRQTEDLVRRLQIKTDSVDALVKTLSGGNQQKVAIAKWLSRQSEIYLLDEPTTGVDIAAKVEIYRLIGELAERGAAVLVLSSDIEELLGVTHRVLVFFRGRVTRQFISSETSPDEVLADVTGAYETLRHAG